MPSENQPIETVSFLGWYKKFVDDSKTGIRLNSGKRFDERVNTKI